MLAAIVGAMLAGFVSLVLIAASRPEVRADDSRLAVPPQSIDKTSAIVQVKFVANGW